MLKRLATLALFGPLATASLLVLPAQNKAPDTPSVVVQVEAPHLDANANGNKEDLDIQRKLAEYTKWLVIVTWFPASNPAYCYEWAFIEPGRAVVLNLWHGEIQERNGKVWCDLNPRAYSEKGRSTTTLQPSERGTLAKRAIRMDQAIAYAFGNQLPVRIIVGEGTQRDITNPKSKAASRMKLRLLDTEPWSVQRYNQETGECRLSRGTAPRYVDQFTTTEPRLPQQHEVSGKAWERDRKVRDAALLRAAGKCELCGKPGFRMAGGGVYLETHHVVPLSEKGVDHARNVAALCPNDHREAHHGEHRDAIRTQLLTMLAEVYGG